METNTGSRTCCRVAKLFFFPSPSITSPSYVNLSSWTTKSAIGRHQKSNGAGSQLSIFTRLGFKKQAAPTFFLKQIHVVGLPLCPKALALNKYTLFTTPAQVFPPNRGVINTSSEALFKDNHCFLEWSTTPTPSFLSFSLLLFSRFHLRIPWCPLSPLFQVKLSGIRVKAALFPLKEKNPPVDAITLFL